MKLKVCEALPIEIGKPVRGYSCENEDDVYTCAFVETDPAAEATETQLITENGTVYELEIMKLEPYVKLHEKIRALSMQQPPLGQ